MMIGNYRVGRELATGGMSSVYRGLHQPTGRSVAIKVLSRESARDEVLVHRMEQEARIQNILGRQHSGIVTCYEPLVVSGHPGLVLEFVAGAAVTDWLEEDGVMGVGQALDVAIMALDALAFAHGRGVIHRDIKPENILVGADGQAKLTDFGVARSRRAAGASRVTESRDLVGTMVYMAPEQLLSPRSVDPRADLYSLGVTLFEMLTDALPFDGEEGYPLMKRIEMDPAPDPREFRPELPSAVAQVVLETLSKDPAKRPRTAVELAGVLMRIRDEVRGGRGQEASWETSGVSSRGRMVLSGDYAGPRWHGWLEEESGRIAPGRIYVPEEGLVVGRSAKHADIVIPDDRVAKQHALILPVEERGVVLVDLAATSSTSLNAAPVSRSLLRDGDRVCFGDVWRFEFHITEKTARLASRGPEA